MNGAGGVVAGVADHGLYVGDDGVEDLLQVAGPFLDVRGISPQADSEIVSLTPQHASHPDVVFARSDRYSLRSLL